MVILDTGTPDTSRQIYSEDADDGTRTRNLSVINLVLKPKPRGCEFKYDHRHPHCKFL